jgi:hypothetical protein
VLEEAEQLEPRVSALEEDMDDVESSEEEEEEDEKVSHLRVEAWGRLDLVLFCSCFQTLIF